MLHQPQLIPDEPTPEQVTRDAERAEYLERLCERLQDPEFRAIEGYLPTYSENRISLRKS